MATLKFQPRSHLDRLDPRRRGDRRSRQHSMNRTITKKRFDGKIIMIGYGSIGKGLLPLLESYTQFEPSQLYIIAPEIKPYPELKKYNCIKKAITAKNLEEVLDNIAGTSEPAFIINVSVDVDSVDVIAKAQKLNSFYIDTATEAWPGFYTNTDISLADRSNYMMRERVMALKMANPNGPTAISCCGANPGMVSWLVKEALLNLRNDINPSLPKPATQEEWARLMYELEIKGIHIAERDSQETNYVREMGTFANTWSPAGCISECIQASELGWGTHEISLPENGNRFENGSESAIYLDSRGGETIVKTWVPTGPQEAFLITHNEAISLAEYFTVKKPNGSGHLFRPTVHYAYRPSNVTVDSIHELMASEYPGNLATKVLREDEITSGKDYLGVLLYGHAKNAYWYGSILSIEEARSIAPNQNATGLQVASAMIAGIMWALDNPHAGIVESEQLDHEYCLNYQRPYLGSVEGHYTDWSPSNHPEPSQRWQFTNVLVSSRQVSSL